MVSSRTCLLECFDKILEIEPNHRTILQYKAYALVNLDRCDEALNCYDEFVSRMGGYQSDYATPLSYLWGNKTCQGSSLTPPRIAS